jgi:Fur family transcriptional regulator, ferric uptake regulator
MSTPRRHTRQRATISAALQNAAAFRTAQDLHEEIVESGTNVGLTTVYRTLQSLTAEGMVDVVQSPEGDMYRMCGLDEHHHHLVCRSCGVAVEVEGAEIESWVKRTARRYGFTDTSHTAEVFGLCERCSA